MIKYKNISSENSATQWEINEKKFNNISSSPVCSDIYQIDDIDDNKKNELKKDINSPLHKDVVDKISKFLEKDGCFLVTGFRGVGKSSVVNRAISQFRLNYEDTVQTTNKLILTAIPLEQSLDLFSLVRIIFRNIFFNFHSTYFENNIGVVKTVGTTGVIKCKPKENDTLAKSIMNKLENLYFGLEIYLESIRKPELYAGLKKFGFSITKGGGDFSFLEGENIFSSQKATTSHLIYELKDFINLLSLKSIKFIFVFDELDRLKSQEEIIEEKEKKRSEIYLMEMLVKELKVLFNQSKANFIFIAGIDLYEKWQAEKSRGDGIYEGIFSENFYINSLLTLSGGQDSESLLPVVNGEISIIDKLNKQYVETYFPTNVNSAKKKVYENNTIKQFIVNLITFDETLEKHPDFDNISIVNSLIPGTVRYYCDTEFSKVDVYFKFSYMKIEFKRIRCHLKSEGLEDNSINDITYFLDSSTEEFVNLESFKGRFVQLIKFASNKKKRNMGDVFNSFFEVFYKNDKLYLKDNYTVMFQSFCRYLRYKSRGILRKLIREINNFIVVKENILFLYFDSNQAKKIKFFSGVEKLIQTKMPAHYLQNDKNKVLLYSIIDNAFKFYKIGLNLEDWETFSILPDREKVLIDKKIYNDALDILKGNYIEFSFGRKTLFQFTPKYSRQIDNIIKRIPHEQHNFNISLLDYNEHITNLQNQLVELNEKSPTENISNMHIQVQIAKIYVKLNNPFKAINMYTNAIKLGTEQVGKIVQNPGDFSFRIHNSLSILDLICECYIEIGLLEFEVQNNKKSISYLWSGVKVFLDFYEWLVNHSNFISFKHEGIEDGKLEKLFFSSNPFAQQNKEETLSFFGKLLDFVFYERENLGTLSEEMREFDKQKMSFLDMIKNEKSPKNLLKIQDRIELKKLLKEYFHTNLTVGDLEKKLENAFFSIGFDPETTFNDNGKLGFLSSYLIMLNQKLQARNLPEFFSPKLLYCVNTLSTVYSRLGQFELSAQLLISGLTIADNTSFHSNAIVQRLQLALFYLLRFDFIKSLKYYKATFRYLNVQKKYGQSDYYMNNELLAGIFDMVGILQNTLVPFKYGSSLITVDNISNWDTLLPEIHGETKISTQKLLANKLKGANPSESVQTIDVHELTNEMKEDIVAVLNTKRDNLTFYRDEAFGKVTLTPEEEKELNSLNEIMKDSGELLKEGDLTNQQKEDIKWFNITILKKCFPKSLLKSLNVNDEVRRKVYLLYSFTAQNYYIKDENKRKNISSKLKLVKSLIYQAMNEFYLIKISTDEQNNRLQCFFSIINEAIIICQDILTMGRNKDFSKKDAKIAFSIVRNSGDALSYLGEISLILSRVSELLKMEEENNLIVECKSKELLPILQNIWKNVSVILKDEEKYCILKSSNKLKSANNSDYYVLSEKFLRLGERFMASFYMPESNNIPLRLGMTIYFFSMNDLNKFEDEIKIELLEVAAMYLKKAIKGFGEYQDFEHSSEEWIVGAYSDLGNIYHKISDYINGDESKTYFLKLAIENFKNSLEIFSIRMNDLFASLTGKEPKLRVSLDSLFDTDYCFYLFQKLSRKMVSSHWKNTISQRKESEKFGSYGFYADTALVHDIGKFLKKCLNGNQWDLTLEDDSIRLGIILKRTKYLSNIFRNFGGIEDEDKIKKMRQEFKNEIPVEKTQLYETDPFWKLITILNDEKNGELRNEAWPIGGYRFIVDDEASISEEIENFTKEYLDFRSIIYKDQMP